MKAIAVDDEPIALGIIESHAVKVPFLELKASFTDAFKAMDYLQRESIDLIFLDIRMPDISGIDFYRSLNKKPLLIFTTAYSEHAVTSFEMDAVDYLLKPFPLVRFVKACNKAYELYNFRHAAPAPGYFYLKTGYEQVKLFFDDVLYLEAAGNYVTFVLKDKRLLSRITFSEAAALLPPQKFVRTHRSYTVAVDKIDKIEKQQVTVGKVVIPISDAYSQELAAALKK